MAITKPGDKMTFVYTGGVQTFTIPITGVYQLDVYGAMGGTPYAGYGRGGYGGRAYGNVELKKGQVIYIYCGGVGSQAFSGSTDTSGWISGGFNGGGACHINTYQGSDRSQWCSGGGATHIALVNGLLQNLSNYKDKILIVGGGGGGGSYVPTSKTGGIGGGGGGTNGENGRNTGGTDALWPGYGASQTDGGISGAGYTASTLEPKGVFGRGANSGTEGQAANGAGGGGGWYGGGAGARGNGPGAGGGGSGHLGSLIIPGTGNMAVSVQNGNGVTFVTLLKKSVPTMYIGSQQVDALMLGSTEISDMALGNKML